MTQYINKDAVVAEIKKKIKYHNLAAKEFGDEGYKDNVLMEQCKASACKRILSFIDTLEVKEVDLQKDSLTWKDIILIDHLLFDIKEDYDNGKLDKEKYYKEVLKKFKAQL